MPFSQVLGRIAYAPLAFAQSEHVMKERGMPEWLITHQRTAGEIAANGGLTSERTEPIRNIVGPRQSRPGSLSKTTRGCS
jgi:hypothetical protein